jgi:hypothetical protein
VKPQPLLAACQTDANSKRCHQTLKDIHNPFYIESVPSGTQSQGWVNAWNSKASEYAVEAETTSDVVTAVNFARQHHLKLVIKGTGHDYLGRSNAPQSLLIWTHKMRQITFHPAFTAKGCSSTTKTPAFTVGAGARWFDVYNAVGKQHHLYVQGGGCTTVGAAGGFPQGGGFGSFSKKYGTGAAGVLQVEIVTADGKSVIANQCQHPDLFWAVRGGGGGTFGVVTQMTFKPHPLSHNFGLFQGTITAKNDVAYKNLLRQFLIFFRQNLNNENWGEQVAFNANNKIHIGMLFQGLNAKEVDRIWSPLRQWIKKNSNLYSINDKIFLIPGERLWDYSYLKKHYPELVSRNTEPGAAENEFWWTSDSGQVSEYWYSYQSWWLPKSLFEDNYLKQTSEIIFKASRLANVAFHINKGLAGASSQAITESRKTSTNPAVYAAPALVIIAGGNHQFYPGVKGYVLNKTETQDKIQKINAAIQLFMQAAPHSGAYANEADYFQKNWQQVFWGNHYQKLFLIKQKYDPEGLFYCHHCVGSERWENQGMCLKRRK